MLHIPLLRHGKPYTSIETTTLLHHATGAHIAQVSLANPGLIRRDIHRMNYNSIESFTVRDLLSIAKKAATLFSTASLPLGNESQSFNDYIRQLSATTGMPYSYCRDNAAKIFRVLDELDVIIAGLTRGFDLSILDQGFGYDHGRTLSWQRQARTFGAVLPSNSPGVHSLWIPAFALKTPLILKPGREEPWTPWRIIQSLIAAGAPPEAFGFYPADHAGSGEILNTTDRSMLFGDAATTRLWASDPRVELHGPGYSKVILGEDAADHFADYVETIASSIAANGGRSCINASAVYTPKNADALAAALAQKLSTIRALPAEDPNAQIAAFSNPDTASRMNSAIDALLATDPASAQDLTLQLRGTPRLQTLGRCAYLLRTIIRSSPTHPIPHREYPFPFATPIESP